MNEDNIYPTVKKFDGVDKVIYYPGKKEAIIKVKADVKRHRVKDLHDATLFKCELINTHGSVHFIEIDPNYEGTGRVEIKNIEGILHLYVYG